MTKQRKPLGAKIAEPEAYVDELRDANKKLREEIKALNASLIMQQQIITELEREKIKNDKPWYTKFFSIAIALVIFTSCQKEPVNEYNFEEVASERNVTIVPFSRIQRNDTTIILDGDSRMRRYCCTIYRESGVPYGDCYSSSGECVSCEEVCAVIVPRNFN